MVFRNATNVHEEKLKAFVKQNLQQKSTLYIIPGGETLEVFHIKSKQDRISHHHPFCPTLPTGTPTLHLQIVNGCLLNASSHTGQ